MKKLIFIALSFFIMSAFNAPINKEEMSNLKTVLQEAQQGQEEITEKLFYAVADGKYDTVWYLLDKKGVNPNATMDWNAHKNMPILYLAIIKDRTKNYKIVDLLLKYGANPDFEIEGDTPLIYAVNHKDIKLAKILINSEYGYGILDKGFLANTPLNRAVQLCDFEMMNLLISAGANPNGQEVSDMMTPLYCLSLADVIKVCPLEKSKQVIDILLAAGADINKSSSSTLGPTPLKKFRYELKRSGEEEQAVYQGIIDYMIEKGAKE